MAEHQGYPRTRLLVESALAASLQVSVREQAHYLRDVLRLREGDDIALFNGRDGEWRAILEQIEKKEILLRVDSLLRPQSYSPDAWLVFAPVKQAKHETMLEKVTELGARAVVPVYTKHTVVDRINPNRLTKLLTEAAEQSERMEVPVLKEDLKLETLLAQWPAERTLYYGDESGAGDTLRNHLPVATSTCWAWLVGPEGGFSSGELAQLRALPFAKALSLGPRVLKADTAAIAGFSCLMSWLGDWNEKPSFRSQG